MAFCRLPWQGIQITPLGDFRMCALLNVAGTDKGVSLDENGNTMNVLTHSFNQALNGKWQRSVRLNDVNNNNAWHEICACCREREAAAKGSADNPHSSRRQSMERRNPSTFPVNPESYSDAQMDKNGYVPWNPTSLDIRFGNLCNQACVQCGPHNSNMWYEEAVGYNKGNEVKWSFGKQTIKLERDQHKRLHIPNEVRWWESPVWWEKFDEILPTLEHIYLTGGEPMIVPAHDEMLDRIIASGYAKNIYLDYDTNLSVINDRLAQRWNHFKHVEIAASMDAAYEPFNLIRTGNWEVFKRNVVRIKEYEQDGVVKLHRLTSCAQISTSHTLFETEDWVAEQQIPFQVKFIDYPLMHNLASLPRAAKEELVEYYSTRNSEAVNTVRNWLMNHMDAENIPAVREYIKFMDYLDTTRNTNWRSVLPGTWTLLNKYIV
jgi:MoaA/NifB/PqqE/SkfB family radical SAM enzyme